MDLQEQEQRMRIKQVISHYHLTQAAFSDKTGIDKTSLSFIVANGKRTQQPNEKHWQRIEQAFPDINPDWLRTGTGTMLLSEKPILFPTDNRDLFAHNSLNPTNQPNDLKYRKEKVVQKAENKDEKLHYQSISSQLSLSENIDKVIIFFKNKTHVVLVPEE